jgi:hypothetical protein
VAARRPQCPGVLEEDVVDRRGVDDPKVLFDLPRPAPVPHTVSSCWLRLM